MVAMVTGMVVTVAVRGRRHLLAWKVTYGHFCVIKMSAVSLCTVAMAIRVVRVASDTTTVVLRRCCDIGPPVERVVEGFVVCGHRSSTF